MLIVSKKNICLRNYLVVFKISNCLQQNEIFEEEKNELFPKYNLSALT